MINGHTREEWEALSVELRKITNNPFESRERRQKAQTILDSIPRMPNLAEKVVTTEEDFERLAYYGQIL